MDIQAILVQRGLPAHSLTITMKIWQKDIKLLGMETSSRSAFTAKSDRPLPFYRPHLTAILYNQLSNHFMKDLEKNSEHISATKCLGLASKLESQERNFPHHNMLLWLRGSAIGDIHVIEELIRPELALLGEEDVLCGLIRSMHRKHHSS